MPALANRHGKATGGRTVYGASVGILMLESRFPRIPGDVGNALTWPFPVRFKVVRGATPDRVVARQGDGLLDAFVAAGEELVADGVDGITTSCGFLSLFQAELAARLPVPVATSSLMQAPLIERLLAPGKRVGIVTASAQALTPAHLRAAGVAEDTPLIGTEGGRELSRVMVGNEAELDVALAERDMLEAGRELVARRPEVAAVLLECTNMVPYARAVSDDLGLPVYSIYSFVSWFQAGLTPRRFPRHDEA